MKENFFKLFPQMENCKNCKYVETRGVWDSVLYNCAITGASIDFPRLMGGSKKCVCYTRGVKKQKDKFEYPALSDLFDTDLITTDKK